MAFEAPNLRAARVNCASVKEPAAVDALKLNAVSLSVTVKFKSESSLINCCRRVMGLANLSKQFHSSFARETLSIAENPVKMHSMD